MNAQEHMGRVAALGCCVCRQPAQVHHVRGGSVGIVGAARKSSDWMTIPLCEKHHTGVEGIHAIGVQTWERRFGSQTAHLLDVEYRLGVDIWHMASLDDMRPRRYKRPSKIIPRGTA